MKANQEKIIREQKTINSSRVGFSAIRVLFLIGTMAMFVLGSLILSFFNRVILDEIVVLILLNFIFAVVLIVTLTKKRLLGDGVFKGTNFGGMFVILLICWILVFVFNRLPNFFAPVIIIALLLNSILPAHLSMGLCFYFNTLLCLIGGMGTYSFYCYGIVMIIGVWIGDYLKDYDRINRFLIHGILFVAAFLIPVMFSYISIYELQTDFIKLSAISAALTTIVAFFFYPPLIRLVSNERRNRYEVILDDNYSMLVDLKSVLPAEYNYALIVSKLAAACSKEIGADELAARAGGLYYNMYNVQTGADKNKLIIRMTDRCFPTEVISIMTENGDNLPSSKESAICLMANRVLSKLEALKNKQIEGDWNIRMIIYQTLNEVSAEGLLDESGLSMNEFLKVRECMIREISLL